MSEKKIALVTGASRGIGRAIAEQLVADGFFVVGTATSEKGAAAIGDALGANGAGKVLNVTDKESVASTVKSINDEFGAPLVLVNNAGITRDNIMLRMKDDEWEDVIDTNLNSLYRVSKACLKGMTKARWGRIINISSVVGTMGNAGQANYAAAKGGVEGFTRALARELGSRNITVNSVAPGFIQTDMTEALPEAQKDALLAGIPLARLGQPGEIASAVGWLASDGGGYVTGTTLHVNGGMFTG
ncbi:3-oxoacyl-[acyl-carrier-protein] reductase [Alcanivorax sp. HI0033]|uniref:3-oxoacyl-ACP reductase FabG n=1 Tax=unclassified Alcanivorax TaxID=2638842 RepID=UPI0007B7A326|nr:MULTISPECIES: 3-oxoacyl-ACP reductase FabG [unclassified Alcanivorax]KZX78356.1 3-oxoacyl-[acyl-carrier-protein] reductase [Alcanivorax sp. HI0013]KZX78643.1 3-oxoacyl-[acyl-carrier-protein] reductase [Alcanivorax sp. HI0011]KZY27918.1 3-oxoacyl-[acyl-carrier-protein] reductase [Alcanivorax sp. HI0035]KZX62325.1 3-oxoacyl-[acyl-carrier-protein] reductase [Alcanivorax sp. HI0003]KZX66763.1 3-oxoacyl-[acyl-carrier-protein] reductase [Alcanivorax sp. HI0007]